jgi:hypothetical protein
LSGQADYPELLISVWHKGALGVAETPLGEVVIALDTIDPTGGPMEQTFALQPSGRMKTVTGDVSFSPEPYYFKP